MSNNSNNILINLSLVFGVHSSAAHDARFFANIINFDVTIFRDLRVHFMISSMVKEIFQTCELYRFVQYENRIILCATLGISVSNLHKRGTKCIALKNRKDFEIHRSPQGRIILIESHKNSNRYLPTTSINFAAMLVHP